MDDARLDPLKSVKIGERYAIAVNDFVVAKQEYRVYHVMDIGKLNGKIVQASPEYEDCKKISKKEKVSVKNVYDDARSQALR